MQHKWMAEVVRLCKEDEDHKVRTLGGRLRYIDKIKSEDLKWSSEAERKALNTIPQGSAADIAKTAMVRLHAEIQNGSLRNQCNIILMVKLSSTSTSAKPSSFLVLEICRRFSSGMAVKRFRHSGAHDMGYSACICATLQAHFSSTLYLLPTSLKILACDDVSGHSRGFYKSFVQSWVQVGFLSLHDEMSTVTRQMRCEPLAQHLQDRRFLDGNKEHNRTKNHSMRISPPLVGAIDLEPTVPCRFMTSWS